MNTLDNVKFSVIIPVYNKEALINSCLDSVINQTYQPDELIVINDGSTDNSLSIIEKKLYSRNVKFTVKCLDVENGGVSKARNIGVSNSANDHVAFLDADDNWAPGFLEEMNSLISDFPGKGMYSCNHSIRKYAKADIVGKPPFRYGYRGEVDDFFYRSLNYSLVNSSKVVISKKVFEDTKGFPEGIRYGEDIYLWIKIALISKVAFSSKTLVIINQIEDCSRGMRVNDILYPILSIKNTDVQSNKYLKRYLKKLIRNGILIRMKELNRPVAYETIKKSARLFPLYSLFLIPMLLIPTSLITWAYKKYKRN